MATWIFNNAFLLLACITAGAATLLLLWYLIRRPPLDRKTKVILLFGVGLLPLATAANGNVAGFQATKQTKFCGSCHVMTPYSDDSHDPFSTTLAARHARNGMFGKENCYTCHADYGMFGTVTTKLGGLRHVYEYSFNYRNMPLDEFLSTIHILRPFPNATCMHCHSTTGPSWNDIPDHASARPQLRDGTVSCASEGCHGPAHPFSKETRKRREAAMSAGHPPATEAAP